MNTTTTQLAKLNLNKKGNYITNLTINMTASTLLNKVNNITIKDASGKTISGNSKVGTGSTITFADGQTLKVVVYGDLDGDGSVDALDLLMMVRSLNKKYDLKDCYLEAARIYNTSGNIDAMDLLSLVRYLNGKLKINQA